MTLNPAMMTGEELDAIGGGNLMDVVWKDAVGFGGFYEVSNTGMVRRHANSRPMPGTYPGKARRLQIDKDGYPVVMLSYGGKRKLCKVHALVATAFIGPRPTKHQVNHVDGTKCNNAVENLEYVTCSQNLKHAYALGLKNQDGESNPSSTLTSLKVKSIIRSLSLGVSGADLARYFNVAQCTISVIKSCKSWTHLPRPDNMSQLGSGVVYD